MTLINDIKTDFEKYINGKKSKYDYNYFRTNLSTAYFSIIDDKRYIILHNSLHGEIEVFEAIGKINLEITC